MDKRLAQIALRGLTLPEPTRLEIRKTGIFSRATVEPVFQENARRWALRGEEAGGAVSSLGHYVGFCGPTGEALTWTQRVQNFMPEWRPCDRDRARDMPCPDVPVRAHLRRPDYPALAHRNRGSAAADTE